MFKTIWHMAFNKYKLPLVSSLVKFPYMSIFRLLYFIGQSIESNPPYDNTTLNYCGFVINYDIWQGKFQWRTEFLIKNLKINLKSK